MPIGVLPMGNLGAARHTRLEIPDVYRDHFREYLEWLENPRAAAIADRVGQEAVQEISAARHRYSEEAHTFRQAMPTAVEITEVPATSVAPSGP